MAILAARGRVLRIAEKTAGFAPRRPTNAISEPLSERLRGLELRGRENARGEKRKLEWKRFLLQEDDSLIGDNGFFVARSASLKGALLQKRLLLGI